MNHASTFPASAMHRRRPACPAPAAATAFRAKTPTTFLVPILATPTPRAAATARRRPACTTGFQTYSAPVSVPPPSAHPAPASPSASRGTWDACGPYAARATGAGRPFALALAA